jgi:hypothetical protein
MSLSRGTDERVTGGTSVRFAAPDPDPDEWGPEASARSGWQRLNAPGARHLAAVVVRRTTDHTDDG